MRASKRWIMCVCIFAFIFSAIIFLNDNFNTKHLVRMSFARDEIHSSVRFKDVCIVGRRHRSIVSVKIFNHLFSFGWPPPYRISGSVETSADKRDVLMIFEKVPGIRIIEDKIVVREERMKEKGSRCP